MDAPIRRFVETIPGGQHVADTLLQLLHYRLPAVRNHCAERDVGMELSNIILDRHDGSRAGETTPVGNPVLRGTDVTDYGGTDFVADPFIYITSDNWHLFFEVFNGDRSPDSAIGHATSPDRGRTWEYDRIVLNTGFHLSFPYVFEYRGDRYLLPEQKRPSGDHSLVLYRAKSFPTDWEPVGTLIRPNHAVDDAVVFQWRDRWWLIAGDQHGAAGLWVYYADDPRSSDWSGHAENPVVTGRERAVRPGGRPLVRDDHVLMFYQDCRTRYGRALRAYRITELSSKHYSDAEHPESPVLTPSERRFGWNTGAMHHLDVHRTGDRCYCVVDGNIGTGHWLLSTDAWSIGAYAMSVEK